MQNFGPDDQNPRRHSPIGKIFVYKHCFKCSEVIQKNYLYHQPTVLCGSHIFPIERQNISIFETHKGFLKVCWGLNKHNSKVTSLQNGEDSGTEQTEDDSKDLKMHLAIRPTHKVS